MAELYKDLKRRDKTVVPVSSAEAKPPQMIVSNQPTVSDAVIPERHFRLSAPIIGRALQGLDICLAIAASWYFFAQTEQNFLQASVAEVLPYLAIPIAASWGLSAVSSYEFGFTRSATSHMLRTANGAGWPLTLLGSIVYFYYNHNSADTIHLAILCAWLLIFIARAHSLPLIRYLSRQGHLSENIVIVGATPNAQRLIERNQVSRDINIVGIFDDRLARAPRSVAGVPLLGQIDDLMHWDRLPDVDRIVVTITSDARTRVKALIDRLRALPQRVILLLDLDGFDPETESLAHIAHSPGAYVSGAPKDLRRAALKRASDLIIGSVLLVFFSPLMMLIAIAIKLDSSGPVFFRQRRHGFNNQIIRIWKFRSMRDDPGAAEQITQQTQARDKRITRIGRFIRITSIDELPQLLNVLKGEMSLVGPRPHPVGMTSEETAVHAIVGDYAHRHRVKPGITGWAQINGSRGPVPTKDLVRERVRLDMAYINRASFWFDLYIMLMTAPCLLGDAQKVR